MVAEALPEAVPARARRRDRARARARRGVAARLPGRSSATGRAEQDPGARWVLGSGDLAAALRARARRRRAGRHRVRAPRGRLALHRLRRHLPRAPPARARAGRQRAALRLGRRQRRAARDLAGRDEKRRGAGALRAARLPPALRLPRPRPRQRLTNTPFWASQGPDGWCRCRFDRGPWGCRGYAEGPLVTCGEPYV